MGFVLQYLIIIPDLGSLNTIRSSSHFELWKEYMSIHITCLYSRFSTSVSANPYLERSETLLGTRLKLIVQWASPHIKPRGPPLAPHFIGRAG